MKKSFLIFLFALILTNTSEAQSCLPDTTIFQYQGQIDAFKLNNPGCKIIEGDIFISGDYITNLDSLNEIIAINGKISIENNPNLFNINGLYNLEKVGKDIILNANPRLTQLTGLTNLQNVGGLLGIYHNDSITSLAPLAIDSAESIHVQGNFNLTDLVGFNTIKYVPEDLYIDNNSSLKNLNGLANLDSIGGRLSVYKNTQLLNFEGLSRLKIIGGDFYFGSDTMQYMYGLDSLKTIRGSFEMYFTPKLINFSGMESVQTIGSIRQIGNKSLINFVGLNNLTTITDGILMSDHPALTSFDGLENLVYTGGFFITECINLTNLQGLQNLSSVGGTFMIRSSLSLANLQGLENLVNVVGSVNISGHQNLTDISALVNLQNIGEDLYITQNNILPNLHGLEGITTLNGALVLQENWNLTELNGLKNLESIGGFLSLVNNYSLVSLSGLSQLNSIGTAINISNNPLLTECAILPICEFLKIQSNATIVGNGIGCATTAEVEGLCGGIPVEVKVLMDADCLPTSTDLPLDNVQVRLDGDIQMALRPTNLEGLVHFGFFENGSFLLSLPQFPTEFWSVCNNNIEIIPDVSGDTTKAIISVYPTNPCPELTVNLGLPSNFRGCLVNTTINVNVKNSGAVLAEGVKVAVVLPSVFEIVNAIPFIDAQNADTLFFDLGNIPFFNTIPINLTVKTRCDTFILGQTLCIEAFASVENACPVVLPPYSEIKVSAICIGDTLVRFSVKNIGDAPTLSPHQLKIFRNESAIDSENFNLDAQAVLLKTLSADGATYRIEATKTESGILTSTAIEGCGGLTSGQITAYWLEKGEVNYDFDCRQVIGSFDPNEKSAIPTGIGDEHLLTANQPIQYTIDFQNTGTDTAFRVLLRDIIDNNLDIATFKPRFASHSYSWEIRGDMLEVLFFPISLPDSNVNEPASHGFFSFEINQKPDLPDGVTLENTANIIFDFNPPIITNTVQHTIGKLTVLVDNPQKNSKNWIILGNPMQESATFVSKEITEGQKIFTILDAQGRLIRQNYFSGQFFDFNRNGLSAGVYFFSINEENKGVFSGKIILID
jgi:uncharacterized repeat protein (TIGR01451 family)